MKKPTKGITAERSTRGRKWGDAVAEAGLSPNSLQTKTDEELILTQVSDAYRHYGRVATEGELRLYRRSRPDFPSHSTIGNRFDGKAGLTAALRRWIADKPEYSDVAEMLPTDALREKQPKTRESHGSVYLIQYGPHFKIGRGSELERRVKQVKIALPESGELIHAITTDDPPGIEAY